eukprot:SAG11_NODE_8_length_31217_cov_52.169677_22_plen_127_part_00
MSCFDTEDEIRDDELILLDVLAFKGPRFESTGRIDTRTYQKPGNTYLFIPPWTEHPRHVLTAFMRGELIRYIKRSSDEVFFNETRDAFKRRLRALGYPTALIDKTFSLVSYADRWRYLRLTHSIRS